MQILKFIAPAVLALSAAPVTLTDAFAGTSPTGIWLNDTGRGAIEIKACGNALCGNVVWVKSSTDSDGCGKQILGGVAPMGGGRWDNGWIYSPEKGRKYDVELTPLANGNLKVVGYAGMKFLSKTMIWKPAPANLQLCTQGNTAAPSATEASAPAATTPAGNQSANVPAPTQKTEAAAKPAPNAAPQPATGATVDAKASPPSPDQDKTQSSETAQADENAPADTDSGLEGELGNMKIGGKRLDQVLTRTAAGKCKLDLPWVKVTIDCER